MIPLAILTAAYSSIGQWLLSEFFEECGELIFKERKIMQIPLPCDDNRNCGVFWLENYIVTKSYYEF